MEKVRENRDGILDFFQESLLTTASLTDGREFHCCPVEQLRKPMELFYSETDDSLNVVFADGQMRSFELSTGAELLGHRNTALGKDRIPDLRQREWPDQFLVNAQTGILAYSTGAKLHFTRVAWGQDDARFRLPVQVLVEPVKLESVCRVDVSDDRKWAGIGYGYSSNDHLWRDNGTIWRYERVELATGVIKERITIPYWHLGKGPERPDEVPTVTVQTAFAACLSPSGNNIIYAVPMKCKE